jgi:hypothetical protein
MTAIIKNNFKLQNARDFLENFTVQSSTRNHYLFIGKPTVWGSGTQTEELSPPNPQDTRNEEQRIWDEMLSLKKIDDTRVSLVIPRSDWDSGGNTIYAVYDDLDPNLYKQPTNNRSSAFGQLVPPRLAGNFYVVTDEFDIFICLNNGNNSPSTVKPIRPNPVTNLVNYSELDGYIWKYVDTISSSDIIKFVTDSWIPVKTLAADNGSAQWAVQQAAIPGQVLSIQIDTKGSGYTGTYSGGFSSGSINNTGSGGVGRAILTGSPSSTTNFYNNGQVHVISGPDAGSIYTIGSYNGATKEITLTIPWAASGGAPIVTNASQIQILPRIDVITNGSPVKLRPIITSGQFSRVIILDAGSGSNFVQLSVPNSLGGTGATIRAVLSNLDKGLGADIEKDLGAYFVMLNARLEYNNDGSGDFPKQNDYRQLGIIRDVRNFGTNTLSTDPTLIATKKLTVIVTGGSGSSLTFDELIQTSSTGIKARVLDYVSTGSETATITYVQNSTTGYGNFSVGQTIQGTSSIFNATISAITNEEVRKGFGEILYLENRRAVLRAPDQIEDIKAIVEF